jgi:hypothetical protein
MSSMNRLRNAVIFLWDSWYGIGHLAITESSVTESRAKRQR